MTPAGTLLDGGQLDRPGLEARGLKVVLAKQPTVVAGHALTSGQIPRLTDFEKPPAAARLVADRWTRRACLAPLPAGDPEAGVKPGELVPDNFQAEIATAYQHPGSWPRRDHLLQSRRRHQLGAAGSEDTSSGGHDWRTWKRLWRAMLPTLLRACPFRLALPGAHGGTAGGWRVGTRASDAENGTDETGSAPILGLTAPAGGRRTPDSEANPRACGDGVAGTPSGGEILRRRRL